MTRLMKYTRSILTYSNTDSHTIKLGRQYAYSLVAVIHIAYICGEMLPLHSFLLVFLCENWPGSILHGFLKYDNYTKDLACMLCHF